MPIRQYLDERAVFGPHALKAMSDALERACTVLYINGQREIIATRIIDLARSGVIDAKELSERVIAEANPQDYDC
jgi:hypothetical protein